MSFEAGRKAFWSLVTLLFIGFWPTARPRAASNPPAWDTFLESAVAFSDQVRAQADRASAYRTERWATFLPNSPTLSLISQDDAGWEQYTLSMNLGLPGRAAVYSRLAGVQARAESTLIESTKLDVLARAAQVYLDCAAAQRTLEIFSENARDLASLSLRIQTLYERGLSTQAENLTLRLQTAQADADLEIQRTKADGLCEQVKTFPGAPAAAIPALLPSSLPEEVLASLGSWPSDLIRAKAQLEKAKADVEKVNWSRLPEFNAGIMANRYYVLNASPVNRERTYSLFFGVQIPLFFLFNEGLENQKERATLRIAAEQGLLDYHRARAQLEQSIREHRAVSARLASLRKSDFPIAQALLESSASSYRSGKLGFAEMILARKLRNDLLLEEVRLSVSRVFLQMKCLKWCERGRVDWE